MSRLKHYALIMLIFAALLCQNIECKSFFGIGLRVYGDQLLLKDVQQSRPAGVGEQPTIRFNYAIPEPITYIEIMSEDSIYAEVDFGYHDHLVTGTVTATNRPTADHDDEDTNSTTTTTSNIIDAQPKTQSIEILLKIYGFNDTMLNVSPAYVLNRDQEFAGVLEPYNESLESVEQNVDFLKASLLEKRNSQLAIEKNYDEDEDESDAEAVPGIEVGSPEWTDKPDALDDSDNNDYEKNDKIIEIGSRQEGDYLIYETYQTSAQSTPKPANHTVTFYYIDSDYITYVKFIVFDHFATKLPTSMDYVAPFAEYTHYSPNTLKAVITEFNTTSVFVQMFMYGYRPQDKPSFYIPFLPAPHWQRTTVVSTEEPQKSSAIERLKRLFHKESQSQAIHVVTDNYNANAGENDFTISPLDMEYEKVALVRRGPTPTDTTNSAFAKRYSFWTSAAGLITVALNLYL